MKSPKLKVAVVGLGIGRQHAAAYTALPDLFELCALCSIDEPANVLAKADFHVPTVVTSYEDLLRMGELDVIDICTPPMLHKPQVLAALRAGKHVICEKPLTNSLLATDDIIGAEKDSGLRVMPIFQYRFGAGLQKLRALTRSGVSGEPYAASVEVHWRRRADYYAIPWRGKFATELGGALTGHAIHAVDMLTYIFGPVRRVTAMTSTRVNPIQVEDTAAVTFEHVNGALSTLSVTLGSGIESTRHRFIFSNLVAESNTRAYSNSGDPWTFTPDRKEVADHIQTVLADFQKLTGEGSEGLDTTPAPAAKRTSYLAPAGYEAQFIRFHRSIVDGTEFPVTLRDARTSIELLSAMYHAAASSQIVELPIPQNHETYGGWHR